MDTILVFPCGTEIALEIFHSIKLNKNFEIIGANSVEDHGDFIYKNISKLPYFNDDNFIPKVNKLIKDKEINYIIPAHDDVILKLVKEKVDCKLISHPLKTCEICRSKKNTYSFLKDCIRTPKIYKNRIKFPAFLKPDVGQGSKGTHYVKNQNEVNCFLNSNLLILEYLPGKEFTIDCFTNYKRELLLCSPRTRNRIKDGISVNTVLFTNNKLLEMAQIINEKLDLSGGAWFFQVKEDENGNFCLLEIAPRIAGSSSILRAYGINLTELSYYNAKKIDVKIIKNQIKIELDRAFYNKYKTNINFEKIYIDFDDTIFINNKINSNIIKFIIECINNNKEVILISKHDGDLKAKLESLKIYHIFSKIIHLNKDDEKYKYIDGNSIFIDDSFSERKKVYEKLSIPVFSLDSLECLHEN